MWELQHLSTNRRTTEISLLLGENTSLTISQIPHNFVGLLSFTLSSYSLVSLFWCYIYGKDALPIYRQASLPLSCKRQKQGKWHQLVLQVAPNWCPFCWLSCTNWWLPCGQWDPTSDTPSLHQHIPRIHIFWILNPAC
jgi:hypothetical protein